MESTGLVFAGSRPAPSTKHFRGKKLKLTSETTMLFPANLLLFDEFLRNKDKRRAESPMLLFYLLLVKELGLHEELTWTAQGGGSSCTLLAYDLDQIVLSLLRRVTSTNSHSILRHPTGILAKLIRQNMITLYEDKNQKASKNTMSTIWIKDPETTFRELIEAIGNFRLKEYKRKLPKLNLKKQKGESKKVYKKRGDLLTRQFEGKCRTFKKAALFQLENGYYSKVYLTIGQIYNNLNSKKSSNPHDHRTLYCSMRALEASCFVLFETNESHPRYNKEHKLWKQLKVVADVPVALEYGSKKEKAYYESWKEKEKNKAKAIEIGPCSSYFKTIKRHAQDNSVCTETIRNWVNLPNNFIEFETQHQLLNVKVNHSDLNLMLNAAEKEGLKNRVAYHFKKTIFDKKGNYDPKKLADVYVQIPNAAVLKKNSPKIERYAPINNQDSKGTLYTKIHYSHFDIKEDLPLTDGLGREKPAMQAGYCTLNFSAFCSKTTLLLSELFSTVSNTSQKTSLKAYATGCAPIIKNKNFIIPLNKRRQITLTL